MTGGAERTYISPVTIPVISKNPLPLTSGKFMTPRWKETGSAGAGAMGRGGDGSRGAMGPGGRCPDCRSRSSGRVKLDVFKETAPKAAGPKRVGHWTPSSRGPSQTAGAVALPPCDHAPARRPRAQEGGREPRVSSGLKWAAVRLQGL